MLGGLDIVVANAGGPPAGNFATTSIDSYQPAIDLNLLSVVGMAKAAIPPMQQQRWGRFVAITSIAVRQPMANLILSNTARSGATGFLKTVAREVAEELADRVRQRFELQRPIILAEVGPVIGTYIGPDAFGATFHCD